MTLSQDFLLNLAAGLAYDLLKAGAARLKALALEGPAQRDLQACYESAFRAMLENVSAGLTPDEANLLDDILRRFVRDPDAADVLLNMALAGAEIPDLPALEQVFAARFDRAGLEAGLGVDFGQAMRAFHRGLTAALLEKAGQPDSPLFNRVNLGRVTALQVLLADQGRALADINRQLARLEAEGGQKIYSIIIEQATGVAIGDGAAVRMGLPAEVQQLVAQMQALVRVLHPETREIERAYLRALVDSECRYLSLVGRDPRASTTTGLQMRLEHVYIALNTGERPAGERPGRQAASPPAEAEAGRESLSALRVFLDHPRLVLRGEPGSGKTTFAEHLALCLAGERLEPGRGWAERLRTRDAAWEGPPPLPIRLRLRHFAADTACLPADEPGRAEHLLAYVEKVLEEGRYGPKFAAHALDCLNRGDALLVLDGLDEVGDPDRRRQVAAAIADLAGRRLRPARVLVTCRVRQYPLDESGRPTAAWALPGFHVTTLADFDSGQIETFIEAWFGELYPDRAEIRQEKIASLKKAVRERSDLWEIAPRPILLTQMALVHDFEGELPGTRVQLYAACADLLLWKWEQVRAEQARFRLAAEDFIRERMKVAGLRKEDLERALDHAVYDAHAGQKKPQDGPVDIPEETLRQRLRECIARTGLPDHEVVARAQLFINEYLGRRNGLIVPAGERTFQTPHRTFQEFMAARWLSTQTRNFDRDVPALVRENFDLWREVFLLAVGQAGLGNAVDAVDVLCPAAREWPFTDAGWRQLMLAGRGLVEIGLPKVRSDEKGPEVEERVTALLRRTAQDLDARGAPNDPPVAPVAIRYEAAETLDRLGWLPDDLNAWVRCEGCAEDGGDLLVMKYPVTNAQFERFIQAGGYENDEWWSDEGWRWREGKHPGYRGEGPVTEPEYWRHPRFGRERRGYPVVGVSWYEAEAYCRWLTSLLRRARADDPALAAAERALVAGLLAAGAQEVRLPADEEWVALAGGEEGDRYPWDPPGGPGARDRAAILARANVSEAGLDGTSPVGMYPLGESQPFRLAELAGNVWEWTAMVVDSESRLVRGGSWYYDRELARCAGRRRTPPYYSYHLIGFRCVSPVSPGSGF